MSSKTQTNTHELLKDVVLPSLELIHEKLDEGKGEREVLKSDIKTLKSDVKRIGTKMDLRESRIERHDSKLEDHEDRLQRLETSTSVI